MVMSYSVKHLMSPLPEDPTSVVPTRYRKPLGVAIGSPSVC
jgi:hypothetical protein